MILICLLSIFQVNISVGQQVSSEIPSSVIFGGMLVKFDKAARHRIEEEIKSMRSNKKFWEEKMDRATLFFPIVENILAKEQVPVDFKYLALQESSFKSDIVSSANAVGFWQVTSQTARELGLRVDQAVDERKNISSSHLWGCVVSKKI